MGLDFSLNVFLCLWIVWTKKHHPHNIQTQINSLQDLAINELVEFIGPLSFIMVVAATFYGPNAVIFGNISNSYWAYTAIEDIQQTLSNMGVFFLIDFSSTIVSATILWFTCQINLWKVFIELNQEFGATFCIVLMNMLIGVSYFPIIVLLQRLLFRL